MCQHLFCQHPTFFQQDTALGRIANFPPDLLSQEQLADPLIALALENMALLRKILFDPADLIVFDRAHTGIFIEPLAGKHAHPNHSAFDAGGNREGSVAHIPRLFSEDRLQKLFLRAQLGFPFRGDLPNQIIAGLYLGADADNPALIQVFQRFFPHIRDVARHFFLPLFRVARLYLEFFNMDGGESILFDQPLADNNGILKIIAAPGHERD